MKNSFDPKEWKVPELSNEDISSLLEDVKNAPPERRGIRIAGTAMMAALVLAGAALMISKYAMQGRGDIAEAKAMLEREMDHNLELIDSDRDLSREYFRKGNRS